MLPSQQSKPTKQVYMGGIVVPCHTQIQRESLAWKLNRERDKLTPDGIPFRLMASFTPDEGKVVLKVVPKKLVTTTDIKGYFLSPIPYG